jgi:hypothetical protein
MNPWQYVALGSAAACLSLAGPSSAIGQRTAETTRSDVSFRIAAIIRHDEALNEAHDVELQENRAYVAGKGGSIAIIDIADPRRPELIWYRRDRDGLADSETVLLAGDRLFLGTKGFRSINISNFRAPAIEKTLSDHTQINTINGMVRRGNTIFAANKRGIVNAINVSDPVAPEVVGVLRTEERFRFRSPHDIDDLQRSISHRGRQRTRPGIP